MICDGVCVCGFHNNDASRMTQSVVSAQQCINNYTVHKELTKEERFTLLTAADINSYTVKLPLCTEKLSSNRSYTQPHHLPTMSFKELKPELMELQTAWGSQIQAAKAPKGTEGAPFPVKILLEMEQPPTCSHWDVEWSVVTVLSLFYCSFT